MNLNTVYYSEFGISSSMKIRNIGFSQQYLFYYYFVIAETNDLKSKLKLYFLTIFENVISKFLFHNSETRNLRFMMTAVLSFATNRDSIDTVTNFFTY